MSSVLITLIDYYQIHKQELRLNGFNKIKHRLLE